MAMIAVPGNKPPEDFKNLKLVDEKTFPNRPAVYKGFRELTKAAGLDQVELYVGDHPSIELDRRTAPDKLRLSKKLLDLLDDKEMVAVLGSMLVMRAVDEKIQNIVPRATIGMVGAYLGIKASDLIIGDEEEKMNRRKFTIKLGGAVTGAVLSRTGYKYFKPDPTYDALLRDKIDSAALTSAEAKMAKWIEQNPQPVQGR